MGQKIPQNSFFPVTSLKFGINLQNFLTFNFISFITLIYKVIPSDSLKLLNVNQYPSPLKKIGFSDQIFINIYLMDILELLNFGYMTTSTI